MPQIATFQVLTRLNSSVAVLIPNPYLHLTLLDNNVSCVLSRLISYTHQLPVYLLTMNLCSCSIPKMCFSDLSSFYTHLILMSKIWLLNIAFMLLTATKSNCILQSARVMLFREHIISLQSDFAQYLLCDSY